jgi:hypothetical protein
MMKWLFRNSDDEGERAHEEDLREMHEFVSSLAAYLGPTVLSTSGQ